MSLVARLRKAVTYVTYGMTEAEAAASVELEPEDIRLAVLMPDKIDKFAIRIAERVADAPTVEEPGGTAHPSPQNAASVPPKRKRRSPGVRSTGFSTSPDSPRQRKREKRASEPVKPLKVSRARALKVMSWKRRLMTAEAEAELRARTKRAKPIEPAVHELINAAIEAGKVTVGPTLHAKGALHWPPGLGGGVKGDGRRAPRGEK